ncbi:MAG TPA: type II toxin-antitoxin system PemK/MazF family toxin [Lacipirellulaceae bacterium]|nr:type II toxin-antitoxin system PemK/MazF family toxin [Lacipirellulaceae bacterium]
MQRNPAVPNPNRGEVWLVDLGYTAKIRPCLVVSVHFAPDDRALIALIPHTTSVRDTRFEVSIPKPFLKTGAFDAQGLVTVSPPRLIRKLGELQASEMELLVRALKSWLGL